MYVDAAEEEIYSCKSQSKEKDNFVYRCCTISYVLETKIVFR